MKKIVGIKVGSTVPALEAGLFEGMDKLSSFDSTMCDQLVVPEKSFKDCSSLKSVMFYGDQDKMQNLDIRCGEFFFKSGAQIRPVEVYSRDGAKLDEGVDYTVSYADNVNSGIATFKATGAGKYSGDYTGSFEIFDTDIKKMKMTGVSSSYEFTGSPIEPDVHVQLTNGRYELQKGLHYIVSYYPADTTYAGQKTMRVAGIAPFTGSSEFNYDVKSEKTALVMKLKQSSQVKLGSITTGGSRFDIDWGDGIVDVFSKGTAANVMHYYSSPGDYVVKVMYKPTQVTVKPSSGTAPAISACYLAQSLTGVADSSFYSVGLSSLSGGDGVLSVGYQSFSSNGIPEVKLSECLSIGHWSFDYNTQLTSISFPKLRYAGKSAFYRCYSLLSASLPELSETSCCTFSACRSMTDADLPKLRQLRESSFYNCSSLTSLNVPQVSSIETGTFYNCIGLSSLHVPNLQFLSGNIFSGLPNVTAIYVDNSKMHSSDDGYGLQNSTVMSKDNTKIHIAIPTLARVKSNTVTSIERNALKNCSMLTSIDFPNLTSIEANAYPTNYVFGYMSVPGLRNIGDKAFYSQYSSSCLSIYGADFQNASSIGMSAFYNCALLVSANVPNASAIKDNAFYYCRELTGISMDNVLTVGNGSFYMCSKLAEADISKVKQLGSNAFYSCSLLKSIDAPNCTSTGSGAFQSCTQLTSANIPLLRSLSPSTFQSCSSLKSVSFPALTSIGDQAFYRCTSLTSVSCPNVKSIGKSAFDAYDSSQPVPLTSVAFNQVTSIGRLAFRDSLLQSITAPNALSIGDTAFSYSKLTTANFPNALSVGRIAFIGCQSLANANVSCIPDLRDMTFYNCYNLTSDMKFAKLSSIEAQAFYGCSKLSAIELQNDKQVVKLANTNAFYNMKSGYKIKVPASLLDAYLKDSQWSELTSHIEALSTPTDIALMKVNCAPEYGKTGSPITPVTIGDAVKLVEGTDYSIAYTDNTNPGTASYTISGLGRFFGTTTGTFKIIELDDQATEVEIAYSQTNKANIYHAAKYLPNLGMRIDWGDGSAIESVQDEISKKVHNYAVSGDYKVKIFNAKTLQVSAYNQTDYSKYAKTIVSAKIPDQMTDLEDACFMYCTNLTAIDGGSGLSAVGRSSLLYCSNLSSVEFDNVKSIGYYGFRDTKISSADFPQCSSVGDYAFSFCNSMKTAKFDALQEVLSGSFYNCKSLSSIYFPSATRVCANAFAYSTSLTSATLENCHTIQNGAFSGCTGLISVNLSSLDYFKSPKSLLDDTTFIDVFSQCSHISAANFKNLSAVPEKGFTKNGRGTITQHGWLSSVYIDNEHIHSIGDGYGMQDIAVVDADETHILTALPSCVRRFKHQGAQYINESAFGSCSALTSIDVPSVKRIARAGLIWCNQLQSVSFPSLTSLASQSLENCSKLKSITLGNEDQVVAIDDLYALSGIAPDFQVYVPASLYDQYIRASKWNVISSRISTI